MSVKILQISIIALRDGDGGSMTFDRMGLVENEEYESGIRPFQGSFDLGCVVMTGDWVRWSPDGTAIEEEHALLYVAFYGIAPVTNDDSDPAAHDSSLFLEECDYRCEDDNQWLKAKEFLLLVMDLRSYSIYNRIFHCIATQIKNEG